MARFPRGRAQANEPAGEDLMENIGLAGEYEPIAALDHYEADGIDARGRRRIAADRWRAFRADGRRQTSQLGKT